MPPTTTAEEHKRKRRDADDDGGEAQVQDGVVVGEEARKEQIWRCGACQLDMTEESSFVHHMHLHLSAVSRLNSAQEVRKLMQQQKAKGSKEEGHGKWKVYTGGSYSKEPIICGTGSGARHAVSRVESEFRYHMTIGEAAKSAKKAICWAAYGASECGDYVSVYHVARYRWSKVISGDNMIEWQKAHIRRDKDGEFPMVTM
ncbi:OLC1v1014672C1 [Oldenlandia corymbosa var. corymbosa]|uniref:OLC1v1014672C1 n=1 Tax=Oldenlandia corymbosa var. corymbosa TaxID=529605 RepID=A0AAV1E1H1_OLDCO|nr:OLC1v1014672C1 [Oldenlandia corymbosa var. corymbosa]